MVVNPVVKDTIEANLACLEADVKHLLAMLADDDHRYVLSRPRYLDYYELAEGMEWDLARLGILLAAPAPALTVGTDSPPPASVQGGTAS